MTSTDLPVRSAPAITPPSCPLCALAARLPDVDPLPGPPESEEVPALPCGCGRWWLFHPRPEPEPRSPREIPPPDSDLQTLLHGLREAAMTRETSCEVWVGGALLECRAYYSLRHDTLYLQVESKRLQRLEDAAAARILEAFFDEDLPRVLEVPAASRPGWVRRWGVGL